MCSCVISTFFRGVRFVAGLRVVFFVTFGMWVPFSEWLTARFSRRSRLLLWLVEFREERTEIERRGVHVVGPLVARTVAIELDAVAVRVVQVDRLADAVVARAGQRHAGVDDSSHRVGERLSVGVADRRMEETGRVARRRRRAFRLPRAQTDVVVIPAGSDERRLLAVAVHHLEAEDAAVEADRTLEVADLEVNVSDVDAGIDRHSRSPDAASHQAQYASQGMP